MVKPLATCAAMLLLTATVARAQDETPAPVRREALDRTGVDWTLPFGAAAARARAEQRLIFVPVIAGGTDATGCW